MKSWLMAGATLAWCGVALAAPLGREDIALINRLTYGVDSQALAQYQALGRDGFIARQLHPAPEPLLPETLAERLPAPVDLSPATRLRRQSERQALRDAPEEAKQAARQTEQALRRDAARIAQERHLWRAIYAPDQLQEQLVGFWLNHFNVFAGKGDVALWLADYEDRAIRPHALGKFRDLVMATLTHPAMLIYLDNAQNRAGRPNENYARELMELHTLGVDAGYTQADVQELARVLTGVGLARGERAPRDDVGDGAFAFHPREHDKGDKVLLGERIAGGGFDEVRAAVDLLCRQPATARFVSRQLARHFLGAEPDAALLARMARRFAASDGDIAATLQTLFASRAFTASLGHAFRDPEHYVIAAVRLAYDGQPLTTIDPASQWLRRLGQPLFGHVTPDGYGWAARDWNSAAQFEQRFLVARGIGAGRPQLAANAAPPALDGPLYRDAVAPALSTQTRTVLSGAANRAEWNALLLSSPEFQYR